MADPRGVIIRAPAEVNNSDQAYAGDSGEQACSGGKRSPSPWIFNARLPLTCMAISRDHPLIAIAGRNSLQVVKICDDRFALVSLVALAS